MLPLAPICSARAHALRQVLAAVNEAGVLDGLLSRVLGRDKLPSLLSISRLRSQTWATAPPATAPPGTPSSVAGSTQTHNKIVGEVDPQRLASTVDRAAKRFMELRQDQSTLRGLGLSSPPPFSASNGVTASSTTTPSDMLGGAPRRASERRSSLRESQRRSSLELGI